MMQKYIKEANKKNYMNAKEFDKKIKAKIRDIWIETPNWEFSNSKRGNNISDKVRDIIKEANREVKARRRAKVFDAVAVWFMMFVICYVAFMVLRFIV